MPELNLPDVVAEVSAAFQGYEKALMANDVAALNGFFWNSAHTLRYGVGENLYGFDQICSFRSASRAPARRIANTRITTFGRDFAVANTEFHRENFGSNSKRVGRQSQTWVRMPIGWRIVSAHVSIIDLP
jgi:hypothetical protein